MNDASFENLLFFIICFINFIRVSKYKNSNTCIISRLSSTKISINLITKFENIQRQIHSISGQLIKGYFDFKYHCNHFLGC